MNATLSTQCVTEMDEKDEIDGVKYKIFILPEYKWNELTDRIIKSEPKYVVRILPLGGRKEKENVIYFTKGVGKFEELDYNEKAFYLDLGFYNEIDAKSI